jgi:hypothetical protein
MYNIGLGVLYWGPCCVIGCSFSPNGALEFVLYCGRLPVSQYNSSSFVHLLWAVADDVPSRCCLAVHELAAA